MPSLAVLALFGFVYGYVAGTDEETKAELKDIKAKMELQKDDTEVKKQ